MNYEQLSQYIHDLQQSGFEVVRLRVQLHKKIAFPVVTFVMALLAIPFALSAGRRGAVAGVATAIGIAAVYSLVSGSFEAMGNISELAPGSRCVVAGRDLRPGGRIFDSEGSDLILLIHHRDAESQRNREARSLDSL